MVQITRSSPSSRRGVIADAAATFTAAGRGGSLVLVIVVALLLPTDLFSFFVGTIRLSPLRVALLALAIPAGILYLQRQGGRFYLHDMLYVAFAAWTALCVIINRGPAGVERAGQFVLETAVIYILVQGAITRVSQLLAIVRILFGVVCVLLLMAAIEVASDQHYWLNLFRDMAGMPPILEALGKRRFDLVRAATVFQHPILHGTFCAGLLSLVWYLEPNLPKRMAKTTVVIVASALAISSGPLLAVMLQIGFISVEATTRWLKHRFALISGGVFSMLLAAHLAAERGIFALVAIVALNPASANYRRLIWLHGQNNVWRSPLTGIRPETWTRPNWMTGSIDNYWLFQAMEGGLPSVIFLASAISVIAWRLFRFPAHALPAPLKALRQGWAFTVLALALVAGTVHFFDVMRPYFALHIALGGAILRLCLDWREAGGAEAGALHDADRRGPVHERPGAKKGGRPKVWLQ